jgi:hypothetical protein
MKIYPKSIFIYIVHDLDYNNKWCNLELSFLCYFVMDQQ